MHSISVAKIADLFTSFSKNNGGDSAIFRGPKEQKLKNSSGLSPCGVFLFQSQSDYFKDFSAANREKRLGPRWRTPVNPPLSGSAMTLCRWPSLTSEPILQLISSAKKSKFRFGRLPTVLTSHTRSDCNSSLLHGRHTSKRFSVSSMPTKMPLSSARPAVLSVLLRVQHKA
jgi:hypothetical protein